MKQDDDQFVREARSAGAYEVHLVPAHHIDREIEAANQGNKISQYVMTCLGDWQKKTETLTPYCFVCGAELVNIHQGGEGIGGFAVVRPLNPASEIALNGAFCRDCCRLGPDKVTKALKAMMKQEFNCDIEHLQ